MMRGPVQKAGLPEHSPAIHFEYHVEAPFCPSAHTSLRSVAGSAVTASCTGTALKTEGLFSSAASSEAGGGSPSERPARADGVALRRELRLRRRKDFDSVFHRGRAWSNNLLVLRSLASDLPDNRFGFVTSKRLGKAVTRNRVRRRLRELVRPLSLAKSWDIVISAKVPAATADFQDLRRAVIDLLSRARLLDETASGGSA
jgi:ribonuclease P protein component